jgi:hypothetical protein
MGSAGCIGCGDGETNLRTDRRFAIDPSRLIPQSASKFLDKKVAGVVGMIVKYLSKFALEVLPSVVATIIGAYIVNHYIVARPAADAPVAATVSTVDPKKVDARGTTPVEQASVPEQGQAQKNTPDKTTADKTTTDKTTTDKTSPEKIAVEKAAAEKVADKPTETASLPAEARRRSPALREKTVARTSIPTAATANVALPVEIAPTQEDRRDANDMARAAIERLRGSGGEASRPPEAPHGADTSRVVSAPAVQPVQPLPPAITVPAGDGFNPGAPRPPYVPVVRVEDPLRPTPPADIPTASRPLDLHAEAATPGRSTVAQDMLSAAKSVFHAVLPQ